MKKHVAWIIAAMMFIIVSCGEETIDDLAAENTPPVIKAFIEIPAGTNEKWEYNKDLDALVLDSVNGSPRTVAYLPYPGNYGFVPNTLLTKENGGDGDPLDILAIGPSVKRGSTLDCKLIGVLKAIDLGEQDDKLIAISPKSELYHVESLDELNRAYPGVLLIIETWFANYKGALVVEPMGFHGVTEAQRILEKASL